MWLAGTWGVWTLCKAGFLPVSARSCTTERKLHMENLTEHGYEELRVAWSPSTNAVLE